MNSEPGKFRGSGKQVLLEILRKLSTKRLGRTELDAATLRLRAGLLVHGSTAEETFDLVSRLAWAEEAEDGRVTRQGIACGNGPTFITDIFETIAAMPEVKDAILAHYGRLDERDYEAFVLATWCVLSAVQMFTELLPVEVDPQEIDVDAWIVRMTEIYEVTMWEKLQRCRKPDEPR